MKLSNKPKIKITLKSANQDPEALNFSIFAIWTKSLAFSLIVRPEMFLSSILICAAQRNNACSNASNLLGLNFAWS